MSRQHSKNIRAYQMRTFQCEVCGATAPAGKRKGMTGAGHIKHMYCIRCRSVTEHVQLEEGGREYATYETCGEIQQAKAAGTSPCY